jgi:hypothetical protein
MCLCDVVRPQPQSASPDLCATPTRNLLLFCSGSWWVFFLNGKGLEGPRDSFQRWVVIYKEAQKNKKITTWLHTFTANTLVKIANTQSNPFIPPPACSVEAAPPQSQPSEDCKSTGTAELRKQRPTPKLFRDVSQSSDKRSKSVARANPRGQIRWCQS